MRVVFIFIFSVSAFVSTYTQTDTSYSFNGMIQSIYTYTNGLPSGTWYYYNTDGTINSEVNFDGQYKATVIGYNKKQVKDEQYSVIRINDNTFQKHGWYYFYDTSGVSVKSLYRKGVLKYSIEFNSAGKPYKTYQYCNNGNNHHYKEYYGNGKCKISGLVRSFNIRVGKWKEFYETGRIKSIGRYNGEFSIITSFDAIKLNIIQEGEYPIYYFKKDGKWIYYNGAGIIKIEYYSNGLLVKSEEKK